MKKRTPKTTIGSRRGVIVAVLLCLPLTAAKKEKPSTASEPYSLIAGTVYRPPGFAFPGAAVTLTPEQPSANGVKLKKASAITDARGEWALRVPPVPAQWRVDVKVDKYRPEQRSVSIIGEQRVDLSIILEPVKSSPEPAQ